MSPDPSAWLKDWSAFSAAVQCVVWPCRNLTQSSLSSLTVQSNHNCCQWEYNSTNKLYHDWYAIMCLNRESTISNILNIALQIYISWFEERCHFYISYIVYCAFVPEHEHLLSSSGDSSSIVSMETNCTAASLSLKFLTPDPLQMSHMSWCRNWALAPGRGSVVTQTNASVYGVTSSLVTPEAFVYVHHSP